MDKITDEAIDNVNHPAHYKAHSKEVIDMMVDIWGTEKVIIYCEINAFKYRMRAGLKDINKINEDIKKAMWYEKKADELKLLPTIILKTLDELEQK